MLAECGSDEVADDDKMVYFISYAISISARFRKNLTAG
jgi:hypothetical protein